MNEFLVTCINKPNRESRHEHITHIGNLAAQWRITREEAIRRIDGKQEAFYKLDRTRNRKVYIGVVREANENSYFALTLIASGMTTCWPSMIATAPAS